MPRNIEEKITILKEIITKSVSCDFCGRKAMKHSYNNQPFTYVKWEEKQDFYDENVNSTIETLCVMEEDGVYEEIIICPNCFKLLKEKKLENKNEC